MWENFEAIVTTFECDDVVQIRGRVKIYNGQKEVTLEQIIPSLERDYDLYRFSGAHQVRHRKTICRGAVRRCRGEQSVD